MLDTESRHSTGLDQGPTRDPWLTMDYYLGTDSVSLQEMLDVDIKCEVEGVIGGHPELGFNFTDLSPLEMDDNPVGCQDDLNGWFGSASLLNGNSNSSNSNFNLDLSGGDAASVMVNPNSVMPHITVRSPSPYSNRPHFSFSMKKEIKEEKVEAEDENDSEGDHYEHDMTETEEDEDEEESDEEQELTTTIIPTKLKPNLVMSTNPTIKTISPQITKPQNAQKLNTVPSIKVQNISKLMQNNSHHIPPHVRKQTYNNNVAVTNVKGDKEFQLSDYDERPYPKPAYSYSCLIAMALKNSRTGSLPVSEIYNFMCDHFPYFKTAPNGWKNSVRHNLSLNKCFEKIEKPAGNGNQRKGCLWAINPAKVAKMDEEVQKWSRKDPLAIKKAMVYPDHLELLERGEMRYAGSVGDLSEEAESSGDDTAEENITYHEPVHSHIAANSITDSYDESSQDFDVDITEHIYDEIDVEDNKSALHMQLNIAKQQTYEYELSPRSKRQKTLTGTLQRNYIYQPVATTRRKTSGHMRPVATPNSFLKID